MIKPWMFKPMASEVAFLDGWTYRKSITLSRASGAVTNYQMKLLVGESSGATGEDVDCGGLCLSSFNDIRFTTSDGTTLLDYWIESISGTTPNQLATIWIEFSSIGTGATTFYMYYGNAAAAAYSNGANTFLFFDDFSTTWNDPVKWTGSTASGSVSGGILTLVSPNNYIYGDVKFSGDIAFRGRVQIADNDWSGCGLRDNADLDRMVWVLHQASKTNHSRWVSGITDGTYVDFSTTNIGAGAYHIYDLSRIMTSGTDTSQGWVDGTSAGTNTTKVPTEDLPPCILGGSSVSTLADWVLVRQFVATEPAWGAWGAEES